MRRDKIGPYDAIAVEENAVAAARRENRAVADLRRAETLVSVPDMLKAVRKFRLPGVDQLRGGRGRTIVGNDDLEIPVVLDRKRAQHRIQRIFAVECRDDHGNQFGHRRPLLPALAEVAHADKPLGPMHASMLPCSQTPEPFTGKRLCKKYQPISSLLMRQKRSKPPCRACCGPTKSWWSIPSASIAPLRSRALLVPVSWMCPSEASETFATARSKPASSIGFSVLMRTSAAQKRCATRSWHCWRRRRRMTFIWCR